jgi:flagellar biosynthesis protein FlhA
MRDTRLSTIGIPAGVVTIVVMLVVPIPPAVLDVLIVVNMTLAVLVLLTALRIKDPLEFSIFPSLLLIATMFRLALNVSATRLVLLRGYAGSVIEAFGHFVVGGSLVVGLVVFLILVVIQFVVITNGAGRVAEVAARFTLDAMPGKQMAIDADLNAGLIGPAEAKARREVIAREADFYGAMDGASKFVKGDAIAALVITAINLIGGLVMGVVVRHLPIGQAVSTYSLLSIGDGLVSQIPALLMSVSTGLVVTRAAAEGEFGSDLLGQLVHQAGTLRMAGAAIALLGLLPGLPKAPFLVVGLSAVVIGQRLRRVHADVPDDDVVAPGEPPPDSTAALAPELRVEPLELELSLDLLELADTARGGDLLERVRALRRQMAAELGLVVPPVRTRDNLELPTATYAIRLHDVEVARGVVPSGRVLVIGEHLERFPGFATTEPVFGLPARWVPAEFRHQAVIAGATVVERAAVITTHLAEVVRRHASSLLSRTQVKELVDMVRAQHPVVAEELAQAQVSLGEIQAVLRRLLEERVSIRDLVRILEAVSERARLQHNLEAMTEAARAALAPAIVAHLATDGRVRVVTFEPLLEQRLLEAVRAGDDGPIVALPPAELERVLVETARVVEEQEQAGTTPALVVADRLRSPLARLLRPLLPRLSVLSASELVGPARPERVGVVSCDTAPV